ncbi:probable ATP-dependent RNA helicase DDX47 [Plectropomus leopardus]|uniref:probable ATP-dependent RNA helicase DDX47 n=1 Tax=Plectropomus leopardus TaxID=160734 RepID=UPI001C4BA1F3|nr:probable ATP-dependent RNA helicase DDX47 [Plectropomus leopardus]
MPYSPVDLPPSVCQNKRLGALNKFKSKSRSVLLATDVASRGLDIPHVDCVINYDIPTHSKDYIHRVGRTARAGRSGKSITFVTQYDVELFQRIESLIGKKLPAFPTQEEEVMMLVERVSEAQRFARLVGHHFFFHILPQPHDIFNRYFKVTVDNFSSSTTLMWCGVPQGSVLGPVLFRLYLLHLTIVSLMVSSSDDVVLP